MNGVPARVHRAILAYAVIATLAIAANLAMLPRSPLPLGGQTLAIVGLLIIGTAFMEKRSIVLSDRGHRVSIAIIEPMHFLSFLYLPAYLILHVAAIPPILLQLILRRPPVKALFNVAQRIVAVAAGVAVFTAAGALGAPLVAAALAGTIVTSIVTDGLVAHIFSRLEGMSITRVYRERLAKHHAIALALGLPAGVIAYALVELHPFALVAAIPLVYLLLRLTDLQARADQELATHRELATVASALIGERSEDVIARRVLPLAATVLEAGRVTISLADGRSWTHQPDAVGLDPPISAPLKDRNGEVQGTIEAWGRAGRLALNEEKVALLDLVGGQASHSLGSAAALAEVASQRDLITRQEKLSALGTLLAGVAHEVNNPLTYIKLRLDLIRTSIDNDLRSGASPDAMGAHVLGSLPAIERGVQQLEHLSGSLKAAARPGAGPRRPTDINEVVDQVVTLLRAGHQKVRFDVDLDKSIPEVPANPTEMHQVVLNLVKNASEALHGNEDAWIRVTTRRDESGIEVFVEDNGPGIPADVQGRLFTPFYTTKVDGTGLGLSISRQIIRAHGGDLLLDSAVGRGTRFTMRLPLPSASGQAA